MQRNPQKLGTRRVHKLHIIFTVFLHSLKHKIETPIYHHIPRTQVRAWCTGNQSSQKLKQIPLVIKSAPNRKKLRSMVPRPSDEKRFDNRAAN